MKRIYCEKMREAEWKRLWPWRRWDRLQRSHTLGTAYVIEGRCSYCGEPVRTVT